MRAHFFITLQTLVQHSSVLKLHCDVMVLYLYLIATVACALASGSGVCTTDVMCDVLMCAL